jgi:hypothetical protein
MLILRGIRKMKNHKLKMRTYACALVLSGVVGHAGAQLIAYEGFGMGTGLLNGASGGGSFGWDPGTWTDSPAGSATIVSSGLQSPASGLTVAANAAQTSATTVNIERNFDPVAVGPITTGSYYLSFLAKRLGPTTAQLNASLFLGSNRFDTILFANNPLVLSMNPTLGLLGLSTFSSPIPVSSSGNPFLIVTKVVINSIDGSGIPNATMSVFTPDNLDAPSALTQRVPDFTGNGDSSVLSGTSHVEFRTHGIDWAIDEIRFGRTLADVYQPGSEPVPEPATLAVLALGAFGALRRRRQGS